MCINKSTENCEIIGVDVFTVFHFTVTLIMVKVILISTKM